MCTGGFQFTVAKGIRRRGGSRGLFIEVVCGIHYSFGTDKAQVKSYIICRYTTLLVVGLLSIGHN